jgi:prevent-host-death family protein
MMNAATLTTFSAKDAKARFGEVLDEALGHPVGITRHDRLTAYIVSRKEFEKMVAHVQYLEDQLWLAKAEAARNEGYASNERVSAFLSDFSKGNTDNEESENDKSGSQIPGKS